VPPRIRLLDRVVDIAPDLAAGDLFDILYRHLITQAPADARLEFERNAPALPAVKLTGERGLHVRCSLSPGADPRVEAHRLLLESTLGGAPNHCVLHAGAVAAGGRALLILGESWAGKTSLVEVFLQRGFALLSDDYAPVQISDLRIVPFPRALGRRAGAPAAGAPPLLARDWVDPGALAKLAGFPVPVGAIAILGEASAACPPGSLRPLAAAQSLNQLLAALRNPGGGRGDPAESGARPAPEQVACLAALAASVPAARLARGPLEAMARAAAGLLG